MATTEKAENSRQLKGLKWQTQQALDGEGKDSLITQGEDGKTIVNLGTNRELFSEGTNSEVEIKEGKLLISGTGKAITIASSLEAAPTTLDIGEHTEINYSGYSSANFTGVSAASFASGSAASFLSGGAANFLGGSAANFASGSAANFASGSSLYCTADAHFSSTVIFERTALLSLVGPRIELSNWNLVHVTGAEIPSIPNDDGTYTLKATVSSGNVSYAWVAE